MLRPNILNQRKCIQIKRMLALICSLLIFPQIAFAQWATFTSLGSDDSPSGLIAFSENQDGYRFEIYKDQGEIIKSRFKLKNGLLTFSNGICPTFQIDNGTARNKSIDNTSCIIASNWSEYIIGKVINNQINSSVLVALMDGITLKFRFRLANGDYRETSFSLTGSKRSLTSVIGVQVLVNEI